MRKTVTIAALLCVMLGMTFGTIFPAPNTNKTNALTNVFLAEFYEGATNNQGAEGDEYSPFWSTVKVIFYTAIFGVIAYVVVRLIVKKSALPVSEDKQLVDIILTKSMGMSAYLQIVKISTAYYLFSLASDGIKLVDKITDKETIDFIELNREKLKPKETKFMDILSFFPQGKKVDKIDFMRQQKDKLKKL
jgi:flagellar biogenesis protein FliO